MPNSVLRRTGWPSDLQRVREVLPNGLPDSPAPGMARFGSWVVVARSGGEAIGLAWIVPMAGEPRWANIEEVAVVEDHQGEGIGSQLVREAAEWMRDRSFESISAYPVIGLGWIERLGFRRIEGGTYLAEIRALASPA